MKISVREAAKALVRQLDIVHEDPQYKAAWMLYHCHGFNYDGPTYKMELDALKDALSKKKQK